jgi:KTSC domain
VTNTLYSSSQRIYVSSSNLRSVGYHHPTGTLEVEFPGGRIYQHYYVPYSVYYGLMNASSKGSYYYYNLRNRYGCTRVY